MLRNLSIDPLTDLKVKKRLISILAAWHAQYKNDLSMKTAANLYKLHRSGTNSGWRQDAQASRDDELEAAKRKNKEEARRKEKEEAERLKREKEEKKRRENTSAKLRPKRKPFNFEEVP